MNLVLYSLEMPFASLMLTESLQQFGARLRNGNSHLAKACKGLEGLLLQHQNKKPHTRATVILDVRILELLTRMRRI